MSLFYNERQALALALRRHVNQAPESVYNPEIKTYLFGLINTFRDYDYSRLDSDRNRAAFDELFRQATEVSFLRR